MTDTTQTTRFRYGIVAAALALCLLLIGAASARAQGPSITFETEEGQAASGAWVSGSPPLNTYATAPSGIRSMALSIDGEYVESQVFPCDYGYPGVPPCRSPRWLSFFLATTRFADGTHTLTTEAVDGNGTGASVSVPLHVDNTAPAPPSNLVVDGGADWRSQPARQIAWTLPKQQFAPITAFRYRLCPVGADSNDPQIAAEAKLACVDSEHTGPALTRVPQPFALPAPGLWTLRVWLVDVAGNSNPDAAAVVTGLGYDPTPPQVAGFAAQDPNDPTRVTVAASDDVAPLTAGAIEVQRRGTRSWRPLATEVGAGGITALVNDERLRRGRYRLRATVVNAAGLQQGSSRGADGSAKTLRLPIRLGSRLQAGRRVGRVCRGHGARRRCRYRLSQRVPVRHGRRITLRARLTARGKPIKHQPLELWQRLRVAGARWQRLRDVRTNGRGRLRYKTAKGPARKLRFRYPGTSLMRGDNATVALRVQARSTLKVSRRNVINGEYVTFRGRLKGRPVPTTGLLVELQVRSRGRWRTFAQPRTSATGAWNYQYRFETVSGRAKFRFRARVRRQGGYPYATGSSRVLGVNVHGL